MSQARTSASAAADLHLDLLTELFADERRLVADASAMFAAALKKSDKLKDEDVSPVAKLPRIWST